MKVRRWAEGVSGGGDFVQGREDEGRRGPPLSKAQGGFASLSASWEGNKRF